MQCQKAVKNTWENKSTQISLPNQLCRNKSIKWSLLNEPTQWVYQKGKMIKNYIGYIPKIIGCIQRCEHL